VLAIIRAIETLEQSAIGASQSNGHPEGAAVRERLTEILGESIASKIAEINRPSLIAAVLEKELVV
jgi:transcription initiation factor TFIID subunit 6